VDTQKKHWRIEFEVFPKTDFLLVPHCIQQSTVYQGYRVNSRERAPHSVFKYTISGCGILEIKGKKYKISAGSGFLTNITSPDVSYYHPGGSEPWIFIFFAFNNAEALVAEINRYTGYVYQIPARSWLINRLNGYADKAGIKLLSPGQGNIMVQSMLGELVDIATGHKQDLSTKTLYAVISRFVLSNLERKLSLNEIARHLHLSKEHLCRVFKEETGMTIGEYIQREKIHHAKNLLRNNTLNIKEIAYRLDYSSASQFNRQFKKISGLTPTEYRGKGDFYM
jgi:AraC-like DNA-binding protein